LNTVVTAWAKANCTLYFLSVSCGSDTQAFEDSNNIPWTCWSYCCCVQCSYSWISDCWSKSRFENSV